MSTVRLEARPAAGEPAWEVAYLFPAQGDWTETDYLDLPGNRLVELSDGFLEILPMPTISHQLIVAALHQALLAFIKPQALGTAVFAPVRVRLWKGKFREPDVVFLSAERASRTGDDYCDGADLVMEVVSRDPEARQRDLKIKVDEYAQARIPEYWIVDPQEAQITVLRLRGRKYIVHGRFGRGSRARSALLKGFEVDVDEALAGKQ